MMKSLAKVNNAVKGNDGVTFNANDLTKERLDANDESGEGSGVLSRSSSASSLVSAKASLLRDSDEELQARLQMQAQEQNEEKGWGMIFRRAGINLCLPFINGFMLGIGELLAHEIAFRWVGYHGASKGVLGLRFLRHISQKDTATAKEWSTETLSSGTASLWSKFNILRFFRMSRATGNPM